MKNHLCALLIMICGFTALGKDQFSVLPLAGLKIATAPPAAVEASVEENQLKVNMKAMTGWPQINIAVPYKEQYSDYEYMVIRIKLVQPEFGGQVALSTAFLGKQGQMKVAGAGYFNASLQKDEFVDLKVQFSPRQLEELTTVRIAAKSPGVACEFIISDIFLASKDAEIPPLRSKTPGEKFMMISQQEADYRIINGKRFKLIWQDEFDRNLDQWQSRWNVNGGSFSGGRYCTPEACYLDGDGHLVLAFGAYPKSKVAELIKNNLKWNEEKRKEQQAALEKYRPEYVNATSVGINTKDQFRYGYHEVKFKMPLVPSPMFCAWFHGNGDGLVEIDLTENVLFSTRNNNALVDYKSSTLHWYLPGRYGDKNAHCYVGYQLQRLSGDIKEAKRLAGIGKAQKSEVEIITLVNEAPIQLSGTLKAFNVIDKSTGEVVRRTHLIDDTRHFWDDGQWHTVALLWEKDAYSFYYDGQLVCRIEAKDGIPPRSQPGSMIISPRGAFTGENKVGITDDLKKTPAKILVDYYRVYASEECGEVVMR